MDDHDLPYKCLVKGCEKLPGFSRTSRLALHEREVHKMHGGYGNNFFCPFKHCERSENDGFAEKEDLADHIRLDHRQTSVSADVGRLRQNGQESDAALSTLPISGSSYTRAADHRQLEAPRKQPRYTISTDCTVSEVARNRMRFMALECGSKHRMSRSGT
jgi:hypothetical protein